MMTRIFGLVDEPDSCSDEGRLNVSPSHNAFASTYIGDEEKQDKMRAIVTAGLTGIAPRDEMEGMIAAQMLACHDASMDCFRYAVGANKTSGLFRDYLNQAGKLSRTFAMLLDALNRHRGKGAQKIS
jgi:hypothetical protein